MTSWRHLISLSLHWRHNDQDGVSNHQPHGCLLNRLFRRRSQKTSKLRATALCAGNSPGPVNSPHKGPVTRKMFPFDDVIMHCIPYTYERQQHCHSVREQHEFTNIFFTNIKLSKWAQTPKEFTRKKSLQDAFWWWIQHIHPYIRHPTYTRNMAKLYFTHSWGSGHILYHMYIW